MTSYQFAFRKLWGLAPTDPRYLDATHEQMRLDVWAAHYAASPKGRNETDAHDDEFDIDELLAKAESGDWEEI